MKHVVLTVKLSIIIAVTMITLHSCVIAHLASVQKPKPEYPKDYNIYLSKIGYDTTYSYQILKSHIDSLSDIKYALNLYKVQSGGGASAIQIRMFDKNGDLVGGYEQCFGEINRTRVLETYPMKLFRTGLINTNLKLENDLNWINITEDEKQRIIEQSLKHEYTAIVLYPMWAGWYSKHPLKVFKKYVVKHGKERTFIVLVNGSPK